MNKKHRGFSIVGLCIVIVVIGALVGGTAWFLTRSQDNKDLIKLTDSSKTLSLAYPKTWTVVPYIAAGDGSAEQLAPDWSENPQPITLRNQANPKAEVSIRGYADVDTTVDKEIESGIKDKFNSYTKVTINGYPALKHVVDFVGPSDAEKYKDTTYTLVHEKAKVEVTFRERFSHATTNHTDDFDVTNLAPDFQTIVNSIKFLK